MLLALAIAFPLRSYAWSTSETLLVFIGIRIVKFFVEVHVIGYSAPLMRMVCTSTGADPVMVTRFLSVTIRLVEIVNAGESWLATVLRMARRACEIQFCTVAAGFCGVTPLATMALYFACRTGT